MKHRELITWESPGNSWECWGITSQTTSSACGQDVPFTLLTGFSSCSSKTPAKSLDWWRHRTPCWESGCLEFSLSCVMESKPWFPSLWKEEFLIASSTARGSWEDQIKRRQIKTSLETTKCYSNIYLFVTPPCRQTPFDSTYTRYLVKFIRIRKYICRCWVGGRVVWRWGGGTGSWYLKDRVSV